MCNRFATETLGVACYDWLFYLSLCGVGYEMNVVLVDVGIRMNDTSYLRGSNCLYESAVKNKEYGRFLSAMVK